MITLVCQLLVVLLISFQNIASMGSWAEVGMSIVSLCRLVFYPVAGSSTCTATEIFLFSWFQWQYNCFLFALSQIWDFSFLFFSPFLVIETTN